MSQAYSTSTRKPKESFSFDECSSFEQNGYVVARNLAPCEVVETMRAITFADRSNHKPPVEYEVDLKYPGAPDSDADDGGKTIRRLKQAHSRGIVFTDWLNSPHLKSRLRQLFGTDVVCPLAHHNCIMTKEPRYSSDTGWHQDIRYWSFEKPELVSVWLALGREYEDNGCLQLIPGSHRMSFGQHQFDHELFFRHDHPDNQPILEQRVLADLNAGDVLFFHCRTLHAATRNWTDETKYAVVFTFRGIDNPPKPGSRSASHPEIILH